MIYLEEADKLDKQHIEDFIKNTKRLIKTKMIDTGHFCRLIDEYFSKEGDCSFCIMDMEVCKDSHLPGKRKKKYLVVDLIIKRLEKLCKEK